MVRGREVQRASYGTAQLLPWFSIFIMLLGEKNRQTIRLMCLSREGGFPDEQPSVV